MTVNFSVTWWWIPLVMIVIAFVGAWIISRFEHHSDYSMDVINLLLVTGWFLGWIAAAIGICLGRWLS